MTRTALGYRKVAERFEKNADSACEDADRFDAVAARLSLDEDTLTGDVYAEAAHRCRQDADAWRDAAARFWAYAEDAELPSTVTVIRATS